MRIEVTCTGPANWGGASFSVVGEFFSDAMPEVGEGVDLVEVDFLVASHPRGTCPPADDLSPADALALQELDVEMAASREPEHEALRARGGSCKLRRKQRRVEVTLVSALSHRDAVADELTLEVFATAAHELVAALQPLNKRTRKRDGIDVAAFLAHLELRLAELPATAADLDDLLERLDALREASWEVMDEWEVLDVEWDLFAPGTRERFDDPFFFDPSDELAPHGNDTGADALAEYLDRRPRRAMRFLSKQPRRFGFASLAEFDAAAPDEHDQLVVAVAFAEVMVTGRSTPQLVEAALIALDRQDAATPDPRYGQLREALTRP